LKKHKIVVKPADIYGKICVILSIRGVQSAKYDSQTKERFMTPAGEISDMFKDIPEDFYKRIMANEKIIAPIVETYLIKQKLQEKLDVNRVAKNALKRKITKLIDANSTKHRDQCILFLTEGDSALGQLIKVRDQEKHAGLPLRGKVLNVTGCTDKEVVGNREIQDMMKAIGIMVKEPVDKSRLRFGKIVLLQDADPDGNCISGLLLNFFHKFWPEMFEMGLIIKYLSPIVIATRGKEIKRFYKVEDMKGFDTTGWTLAYNKGLGSLSEAEYSRMINEPVAYTFTVDDLGIEMLDVVFGPDVSKRKKWLSI
jgi:DNA topoisomerase-2